MFAALVAGLGVAVLLSGSVPTRTRLRHLDAHAVARSAGMRVPAGARTGRSRVRRVSWSRRGRALVLSRQQAVVELSVAVSGELDAGQPAAVALGSALRWLAEPADLPERLRPALAAGPGPDLVVALRQVGELPGAEGLAAMAACWEATQATGAGLSAALGRVGEALRAEQQHRREVQAELAGARASARLLVGLPMLGLLLGLGFGADPLGWLVGSTPGRLVGGIGAALDVAGFWWVARLVRAAEHGEA